MSLPKGKQVAPGYSPSQYTPASTNLDGHLDGIDTALGLRFPQGQMVFTVPGVLTVAQDQAMLLRASQDLTIVKARATVKTAPTDASVIVDVHKNGTTIFSTQGNRPTIASGTRSDDSATPDVTTLADGDEITIDIDNIGSTVAGADLTVSLIVKPA